jgi:hypothetical protein
MAANNALNLTSSGIAKFDGTSAFSAITLTQYAVLVGGASNGITSIAAVGAGRAFQSSGAGVNPAYSTPTYPSASGTASKILISNGTNNVYSANTYPNSSATSRKRMISDGTNWVASTETWATPGTSTNVLQSDATNWTSATSKFGYYINVDSNNAGPTKNVTYFLKSGSTFTAFTASDNATRYYIATSGTITTVYSRYVASGASTTAENSTLFIRVNNTTDNTVSSTISFSGGGTFTANNTAMSVAVTAGDYIEFKFLAANWSTAPSGVTANISMFISV